MSEPVVEAPRLLRIVLDTNIYVGGLILSRGTPYEILEAWRAQQIILIASESIIAEIERVLRYPRIRDRYHIVETDIARLTTSLRADAIIVPDSDLANGVSPDPDDDKFLACAAVAQADVIVTGDPDFLILERYEKTVILKPHEFLNQLQMGIK